MLRVPGEIILRGPWQVPNSTLCSSNHFFKSPTSSLHPPNQNHHNIVIVFSSSTIHFTSLSVETRVWHFGLEKNGRKKVSDSVSNTFGIKSLKFGLSKIWTKLVCKIGKSLRFGHEKICIIKFLYQYRSDFGSRHTLIETLKGVTWTTHVSWQDGGIKKLKCRPHVLLHN